MKALESWTFSLQALAGIANEKALSYVKDGALQSLRDNCAAQGKAGPGRRSEEAKAVETILEIFQDPPRSIVKASLRLRKAPTSGPDLDLQRFSYIGPERSPLLL